MCTLQIHNAKKTIDDLNDLYNIVPAKCFTITPPRHLTEHQELIYIIGLFDGDGWICKRKRDNQIIIGICGNLHILSWIKQIFDRLFPTKRGSSVLKDSKSYRYNIEGKRALQVIEYLNQFCPWKLQRKWNISSRFDIITDRKLV